MYITVANYPVDGGTGVLPEAEGVYACVAESPAGSDSASFNLSVLGEKDITESCDLLGELNFHGYSCNKALCLSIPFFSVCFNKTLMTEIE